MSRGRIIPPNLDDRTWQDLVDQATRLIPSYAPEWTDRNPSDLGITLIELFAWLVEGMSYRLNQVPERNYVEFLNLLGITRDPATPASTMLTFELAPGLPPTLIPAATLSATEQLDDDPVVLFETDEDLIAVATNLRHALFIRKAIFAKYVDVSDEVADAPLEGFRFTVPSGDSVTIALGFDAATTDPMDLLVRLNRTLSSGDADVEYLFSDGSDDPPSWPVIGGVTDGTSDFQSNGTVRLTVPATWSSENPTAWTTPADSAEDEVDASRFWIGVRISNLLPTTLSVDLAYILFNSAPATNAITVPPHEDVGVSDGTAFQRFELRHSPLFKEVGVTDPYRLLTVELRQPVAPGSVQLGPWEAWERVEDFEPGAAQHFRLDPVAGTIAFGNYEAVTSPAGNGSIPPLGSEIRATYRYVGGGTEGNLTSRNVKVLRTPVAGVIAVNNRRAATGASDEESMEEAKRRAPDVLRNRHRAVTSEDYEYLAREATTDVAKVRCLEPRLYDQYDPPPAWADFQDPWTYGGLNRNVGNVNVLIVPYGSTKNQRPEPSEELIREVSDYLQARRTVTASLHVTGPRYVPIRVTLDFRVWQKAVDQGLVEHPSLGTQVEDDLLFKIAAYLHPTSGGPEGTGWEFGQDAMVPGLFKALQPDADVGYIADLQIESQTPLYTPTLRPHPIGVPASWVQIADYELVCADLPGNHNLTLLVE